MYATYGGAISIVRFIVNMGGSIDMIHYYELASIIANKYCCAEDALLENNQET